MNNEQEDKKICSICGEENDEVFHTLDCNHSFHYQCLLLSFRNMKNNHCPYCRSNKNLLPVINGVKKIYPGIHMIDAIDQINNYSVKKCEHILTRGKNKGQTCSKNCKLGYNYCTTHYVKNGNNENNIKE